VPMTLPLSWMGTHSHELNCPSDWLGQLLDKIKLGLGKQEFSTGLTFVALSRVRTIMTVDRLDFSSPEARRKPPSASV
jgi:hypothetical protein